MNIMCPNGCPTYLHEDDVDSRQEWVRTQFSCPKCEEEFELYTSYHIQSSKIDTQILTNSKGEEVNF